MKGYMIGYILIALGFVFLVSGTWLVWDKIARDAAWDNRIIITEKWQDGKLIGMYEDKKWKDKLIRKE